jgi:hypothetical protein
MKKKKDRSCIRPNRLNKNGRKLKEGNIEALKGRWRYNFFVRAY